MGLALQHRCTALVLLGGASPGPAGTGSVPDALARLRGQRRTQAVRALFQQGRLVELLAAFSAAGLTALPLKGPALAAALYGDATLRTSDDLDIWVHPADFLAAVRLLEGRGYVPFVRLSEPEARAHCRAGWDRGFRSPTGDLTVELCTGVTPRYFGGHLPAAAMLEGARELDLPGGRIRVPAPETLAVLLCAHGTKHLWTRLVWVADLARLLVTPGLDWARVARLSRAAGTLRMTALGVHLARVVLGVPLPAACSALFPATPAVEALLGRATAALAGQGPPPHGLGEVRFHLAARERLRDRVAYAVLALATPSLGDWRRWRLPRWAFGLHWVLRPIRLAGLALGRMAGAGAGTAGPAGRPERLEPGRSRPGAVGRAFG